MLNTPSPSQNSFENSVTKRKKICHLPNLPRPNICLQLLGTSLTKTVTLPVQFSPPHPDKGQIPLPGKAFPSTSLLPGHRKWSSARCSPREGGGGDVEVSIWSSHYNNITHIDDDDMVTIKLWLDVSIHSLWPYNVLVSKQSCIVIGDAMPRICNIGVKEQEWNGENTVNQDLQIVGIS